MGSKAREGAEAMSLAFVLLDFQHAGVRRRAFLPPTPISFSLPDAGTLLSHAFLSSHSSSIHKHHSFQCHLNLVYRSYFTLTSNFVFKPKQIMLPHLSFILFSNLYINSLNKKKSCYHIYHTYFSLTSALMLFFFFMLPPLSVILTTAETCSCYLCRNV